MATSRVGTAVHSIVGTPHNDKAGQRGMRGESLEGQICDYIFGNNLTFAFSLSYSEVHCSELT